MRVPYRKGFKAPQRVPQGRCTTCLEPIKPGAKKCLRCDSYQDWRRHLSISSSVLALLVALVSVLTFAIPVFKSATTPKDSSIQVSLQRIVDDDIYLLATNSGIRSGSITAIDLILTRDEYHKHILDLGIKPLILSPGQTVQIVKPITTGGRRWIDYEWLMDAVLHPTEHGRSRFKVDINVGYRNFTSTEDLVRTISPPVVDFLLGAGQPWHNCMGSRYYGSPRLQRKPLDLSRTCPAYPWGSSPLDLPDDATDGGPTKGAS